MAKDSKRPGVDKYGVGMLADGTIPTYTPEQARKMIEQRNADESENDDISDLPEIEKAFGKKNAPPRRRS